MSDQLPGERINREPIAIVGIGCRFPGGADTAERFWELLRDGVDAISDPPEGRIHFEDIDRTQGRVASRQGGFLRDIDHFDAEFFGISPREADQLDPQQRLLLETAWEAFEDAGITREQLAGDIAGVYVGLWLNDYEACLYNAVDDVELLTTTGGGRYPAAGRISFAFDLRGPSLTVDTACSSSLVAVHLAVQALRSGEVNLGLAGGVNTILQPQISLAYSRSGMLAPDGRSKFGDARANGYVRSEGCGLVVLKRLSDALAANDPIYAVIRGSAVNNDGQGSGLLVQPSTDGQAAMLHAAYQDAGIDPGEVSYVEAHGTGTLAGDPVELQAIGNVVGDGREAGNRCFVGSVKTNVGHTEGAAGVAGLIKVALALKHEAIPPSLHFTTPSPRIAWEDLPVAIPSTLTPWPRNGKLRIAGASAFGITGTNAHVVLEEAPVRSEWTRSAPEQVPILIPLSAHNDAALTQLAGSLRDYIVREQPALVDLVYTAAVRRTHLSERLAIVGASLDEFSSKLDSFNRARSTLGLHHGTSEEAPPVVFVFPGQGSQWEGMTRELLASEQVFRAKLEECDAAIRSETGWSVIAELEAVEDQHRLNEIDVIQPVLFAVQVALAELWRSWGINPAAVIGHSMGEVAAGHVAGALTLQDAAAIICRRSRLLRRIRGQGAMALVELGVDDARTALEGHEAVLSVAVSNGPRSTVISGDPNALDDVLSKLQKTDVFCRPVKVDVASHSPQVEPLLGDLHVELRDLSPHGSSTPIYSTVAGEPVDGQSLDAGYWESNLRQPVLFAAAIQRSIADGMTTFIEVSPHPILVPSIQQVLQQANADGIALSSLRRNEPERSTLLESLGELCVRGANIDWTAVAPAGQHLHLPPYPWQRERFWFDDLGTTSDRRRGRSGGHPLLGHDFTPAGSEGQKHWESTLSLREHPYLADHRVDETAIVPATAFIELMRTSAAEVLGTTTLSFNDIEFREALVLAPDEDSQIQVTTRQRGDAVDVQIFGHGGSDDGIWELQARASVRRISPPETLPVDDGRLKQASFSESIPSERHYAAMAKRALNYGSAFQTVTDVWQLPGEVLGTVRPGDASAFSQHAWRIVALDGALQLGVAALGESARGPQLPYRIEKFHLYGDLEETEGLWAHVIVRTEQPEPGTHVVDLSIRSPSGDLLADIVGLHLRSLERDAITSLDGWFYEVRWEDKERPEPSERAACEVLVIDNLNADEVLPALDAATRPTNVIFSAAIHHESAGTTDPGTAEDLTWAATRLVQQLDAVGGDSPPRLWIATRCAQPVGEVAVDPGQAQLWGLGRTVANEHPELRCTLVDIGPHDDISSLYDEARANPDETQVALRESSRFVGRIASRANDHAAPSLAHRAATHDEPFRIEVARPGILDSIGPRLSARKPPAVGEVEIQVEAAGLNFIDVMKAMGICPGFEPRPDAALGAECAGRVVAVGEGVQDLTVGDSVVALTSSFRDTACLSRFVTLPAELVALRPARIGADEAAGQAIVYMTSYYALHELGRIRAGDDVLIHAATGGVGLAAINVARRAGARVFATAGSPEKRAYLRNLGIEHIYDSRSTRFADEVLADTSGRGVDIVLNSLSGEAIAANLMVLAPRGRFIEIGKRDIYDDSLIGLSPFRKNLGFFALDMARMVEEDRADVASLFQTIVRLLGTGELAPIPVTVFPSDRAGDAFREMAQARHIGKLVVRFDDAPVEIAIGGPFVVRSDATYLITGGLGALGLETARWLTQSGARSIALLGRSEPSASATQVISDLEHGGTRVQVLRGDVASAEDVAAVIDKIDASMPPLRGVFHLAGLLDDATLSRMTREQLHRVLAPKAIGAWNLHDATRNHPLDCFVLFSSVASILGLSGQANYAAANAYLDALAHRRRGEGLPALVVNWAPWADIGLAAVDAHRGTRLDAQGLQSITPERGIAALDHLLQQDATAATVMHLDLDVWSQANPASSTRFFEPLHAAGRDERAAPGLRQALADASPDRRLPLLEEFVREQLSQVLRIDPARLSARVPFKSLGVDSLMALELRNRLDAGTGLSLSATLVWNYPTITALAEHLASRLDIQTDSADSEPAAGEDSLIEPDIDLLPQDDVADLLQDELDAVARLLGTD